VVVSIFFCIFIVVGLFQLLMISLVRFSFGGRVCAGDFVDTATERDEYLHNLGYYMAYEGAFIVFVLVYELVSFIAIIISYKFVNE